jgi:hypothetical protein
METTFQYTYYYYCSRYKKPASSYKNKNSFSNRFAGKSNPVLIKELLFNSCFDNAVSKPPVCFLQDFSGYYKNQKIHDIEKTVVNYKKCFVLIRFFDFFKLQMLFLGKPVLSELFFKNLSLKSRHLFLKNEDWLLGFLTKCVLLLL